MRFAKGKTDDFVKKYQNRHAGPPIELRAGSIRHPEAIEITGLTIQQPVLIYLFIDQRQQAYLPTILKYLYFFIV